MWTRIRKFFADSETIFIARLQMLIGAILYVLATTDPNLLVPYISGKWVPVYLIGAGIVTEFARRLRAKDLGKADTDPHEDVRGV